MESEYIVIANVSTSYFSVARYSGGVKINGKTFLYCPIRDILVREDWMKAYQKLDYNQFLEAVKSGVKPELPSNPKSNSRAKKSKDKNNENNPLETPTLFD